MKERCREALERAYLFLDGEGLSDQERRDVEAHLEECGPCWERYGLEREVSVVVSRLKGCSPCPDDLKARISGMLREG